MKSFIVSVMLTSAATLAGAQAAFNPSNGTFVCPPGKSAFCASSSLKTNIIIRCHGTTGQAGNCNDNLAGVPPGGVKLGALCWECSPTAGDASCSTNGTVYPDTGNLFTIAEGNASCNTTSGPISNGTSAPANNATLTSLFTLSASISASLPTNKPLPTTTAPIPAGYGSASILNNLASSNCTTTSTISHTVIATISLVMQSSTGDYASELPSSSLSMVLPSSVPVAPGSGGFASYGSGNASTKGMMIANPSSTPLSTGSPATPTVATGGNGNGMNNSSSPIPVYSSDGNEMPKAPYINFCILVTVVLIGSLFIDNISFN